MSTQTEFVKANLAYLGYTSKVDLIENLYLKSLVSAYQRIDKTVSIENQIRDRFMKDLYFQESPIKQWLQSKIIYLNWENWVFTPELQLARTDISFKISGIEFIIECKKLTSASKTYFDEGLNRFISTKYSKSDEFAGMIGFVCTNKSNKIAINLGNQVKNHSYSETEFSKRIFDKWPQSFLSSHVREDESAINIYHLFFDFTVTN